MCCRTEQGCSPAACVASPANRHTQEAASSVSDELPILFTTRRNTDTPMPSSRAKDAFPAREHGCRNRFCRRATQSSNICACRALSLAQRSLRTDARAARRRAHRPSHEALQSAARHAQLARHRRFGCDATRVRLQYLSLPPPALDRSGLSCRQRNGPPSGAHEHHRASRDAERSRLRAFQARAA